MKLFLKLDHMAGLRSAGGGREPEPVVGAALAELEGVGGITIHLHQDRSNVQLRDVQVLKETLSAPLNLELAPSMKNRQHAFDLRPQIITLVREPRDVHADRWPLDKEDGDQITSFIESLEEADIIPSVLIKPSVDAVRWANRLKTSNIMIDTTTYCHAKTDKEMSSLYEKLYDCIRIGHKLGMEVHAGGGIDYRNVGRLAQLPLDAIHIGHGIVGRAVLVGMSKAVCDMLLLIEKASK